jgi:Transcription termination factor nusG.
MTASAEIEEKKCWYVMRDLKRPNAKLPAYKQLSDESIEVFTPMRWHLALKNGKRVREKVPFIRDLLFVHATQEVIHPLVRKIPTLQYRYLKGGGYCRPMIVADWDMERFIHAVKSSENPRYYLPEEVSDVMCGRMIRIIGGPFEGYEGRLLTTRGSKVKRLLVELPNFFWVGVEVSPDLIEIL